MGVTPMSPCPASRVRRAAGAGAPGPGWPGAACAEVLLGLGAQVTVAGPHRTVGDDRRAAPRPARRVVHRRRADRRRCSTGDRRRGRLAGLRPAHPAGPAAARAPGSTSTPSRSWPGGCAARTRRAWLAVTGTNGKTTTTTMLAAILRAAGLRTARAGQHRRAAGRTPSASRRTTCSPSSCPASSCTGRRRWPRRPAALLNLADDHLEWHGELRRVRRRPRRRSGAGAAGSPSATSTTRGWRRLLARPRRRAGDAARVPQPGGRGRRWAARARPVRRGRTVRSSTDAFGRPAPVELAPGRRGPAGRARTT